MRAGTVSEVTGGQPLEDWLKKVMAQEDDLFRMQQFMKLLETLDNVEDIKTAMNSLSGGEGGRGGRGGPFGSRFTEISMLMSKFVQLDPKGAMAFANEKEGGDKFAAAFSALRTWTRMSPDAALAWAQTEGANMKMDFGRGRDGGGDENAPQPNFAVLGVLSQLGKSDIDKALSVAGTTEFGGMGGRAVDGLASELISQRGAEAARTATSNLPEGDFKNQMVQQLADKLSKDDPKGTVAWVMAQTTGDAKSRALGEVMNNWAETDPTAAGEFLASQPASPEMDRAIFEYSREIAKKEPAKGWEWAQTIQDPERQTRALVDVGRDWMRADAPAAQQAIAASTLPDEMKQRMTQPQQNGGRGPGGPGGGFRGPGGGAPAGGAPAGR